MHGYAEVTPGADVILCLEPTDPVGADVEHLLALSAEESGLAVLVAGRTGAHWCFIPLRSDAMSTPVLWASSR
jgi:hypothetical protein